MQAAKTALAAALRALEHQAAAHLAGGVLDGPAVTLRIGATTARCRPKVLGVGTNRGPNGSQAAGHLDQLAF